MTEHEFEMEELTRKLNAARAAIALQDQTIVVLVHEIVKECPDRKIVKIWIMELRDRSIGRLVEMEEPMPNYGDVFTIEEFEQDCLSGALIDYDGTGRYMIDGKTQTMVPCRPSDIAAGIKLQGFSHVAWYNK